MKPEEISEIVKITLDELIQRKLIDIKPYNIIKKFVEDKLTAFFNDKDEGKNIGKALTLFSDDPYIDVIYLQYRDKKTLEWIAEALDRDISTIKRNKKRLMTEMYKALEEL